MELEHAFQQSGFLVALQIMVMGSIIGGPALLHRFVRVMASYVISFGPMAVLVYMLYKLSQLS